MTLLYWILGIAGVLFLLGLLGYLIPMLGEILSGIIEAICESFDD